jgi:hypothetical protein
LYDRRKGQVALVGECGHVFPMSQVQEAFEVSASRQCAKIILKPWE